MAAGPTARALAMFVVAMQLAMFAFVNVALETCEQQPRNPADGPDFDDPTWAAAGAAAEAKIHELQQELARERELRGALEVRHARMAGKGWGGAASAQQPKGSAAAGAGAAGAGAAGAAAGAAAAAAAAVPAEVEDDGGDSPEDAEADAGGATLGLGDDAIVGDPGSALVFDGLQHRGGGGPSHAIRRFHRPLLVRFINYNATTPIRTPYGGEAARRWFQRHGYVETDSNDWDVLWTGKGQFLNFAAQALDLPRPWQSHNHCLGAGLLAGNKHSFTSNHNIMARKFPEDYTHVPETFDLPIEHAQLLQ